MEVLLEAKKSGQVRHLGFSAHSEKAALEAMDRYDFDSVLFPVNFVCAYKGNFGPRVIEKARSKGAAILGMKLLARQRWPRGAKEPPEERKRWYQVSTNPREADLAFRFGLSEHVTSSVPAGHESFFRSAMDLAMRFRPLTEPETEELKTLAAGLNPMFSSS